MAANRLFFVCLSLFFLVFLLKPEWYQINSSGCFIFIVIFLEELKCLLLQEVCRDTSSPCRNKCPFSLATWSSDCISATTHITSQNHSLAQHLSHWTEVRTKSKHTSVFSPLKQQHVEKCLAYNGYLLYLGGRLFFVFALRLLKHLLWNFYLCAVFLFTWHAFF